MLALARAITSQIVLVDLLDRACKSTRRHPRSLGSGASVPTLAQRHKKHCRPNSPDGSVSRRAPAAIAIRWTPPSPSPLPGSAAQPAPPNSLPHPFAAAPGPKGQHLAAAPDLDHIAWVGTAMAFEGAGSVLHVAGGKSPKVGMVAVAAGIFVSQQASSDGSPSVERPLDRIRRPGQDLGAGPNQPPAAG